MAVVSGIQLGVKLCEILGISPENVIKISFEASVYDVAVVKVLRAVTDMETKMIAELLEQYKLTPK